MRIKLVICNKYFIKKWQAAVTSSCASTASFSHQFVMRIFCVTAEDGAAPNFGKKWISTVFGWANGRVSGGPRRPQRGAVWPPEEDGDASERSRPHLSSFSMRRESERVGAIGVGAATLAAVLHACLGNSVKVRAVELPSSAVSPTTATTRRWCLLRRTGQWRRCGPTPIGRTVLALLSVTSNLKMRWTPRKLAAAKTSVPPARWSRIVRRPSGSSNNIYYRHRSRRAQSVPGLSLSSSVLG